MSANQLAEYALASPSRRQAIIRNAKFAPTFLVIRYGAARAAICDFLAQGAVDRRLLHQAESDQIDKANSADSDFARNDASLSAEAIAAFARSQQFSALNGIEVSQTNGQRLPRLEVSGVGVSVNIDLLTKRKSSVGAIVLQTSKAVSSKSWRDEHSALVASLVWMLAEQHLSDFGSADRKLCFAVDAFAGTIKQAPASYKRRLADLEASCREISMMWGHVTPPSDYIGG